MKQETNLSIPSGNPRLAAADGVFELPGAEPAWIWAHTCAIATCDCRSALVIATHVGRDFLLERGEAVLDALSARKEAPNRGAAIDDLIVFDMDIDSAKVDPPIGDELLAVAAHPRIADIATRIDGDLLDSIQQLWYRGKGLPDPNQDVFSAAEIEIKGWRRGTLVGWGEVFPGAREDLYFLEDRLYAAIEMYCPAPDCDCEEVVVSFWVLIPRGAPSPGRIVVHLSGATEIEPSKNGSARLDQLWRLFQQRHPNYRTRFARRYPVIQEIGAQIVGSQQAVSSKIGRNDACPCGSGKKYKKCCGAS